MNFMGLDHVVFTTSNMKRAVGFYNGLLGMPILHAMEYQELGDDGTVSSSAQHFYFGVGGDNPEAHIAIFAFRDSVSESGVPRDIRQPGAFLHFNLRVNPDRIEEYCRQLRDADHPCKQVTRYPIDANNPPTRETQPVVVSDGVNIYPAEAEQVLIEHPGVRDVACDGVPHADLGEQLKALVWPSNPLDRPRPKSSSSFAATRWPVTKCRARSRLSSTSAATRWAKPTSGRCERRTGRRTAPSAAAATTLAKVLIDR
jgi:catechol 2,3-dioxygenase-like lactoylglutathione lyase family enzyme